MVAGVCVCSDCRSVCVVVAGVCVCSDCRSVCVVVAGVCVCVVIAGVCGVWQLSSDCPMSRPTMRADCTASGSHVESLIPIKLPQFALSHVST